MSWLRVIIALAILLSFAWQVQASANQIVIVLWHGLEWEHLQGLDVQQPLAWGLLNTRSGGGQALSGSYLSIGAGARAVGLSQAPAFLTQDEMGPYELNTGLGSSSIVQPNIALILAAQNVDYIVTPGALGTALQEAAKSAAVFGNSDTQEKVRWAPLIIMDTSGRVFRGVVGAEILIKDPTYPYGVKTNYKLLAEKTLGSREDLIIVDLGDPFRFDQYEQFLMSTQKETLSRRMAREALLFVENLAENMGEKTIIFVLSPHPAKEKAKEGLWLTPFLSIGWAEGLFNSGTTKWPGILTNMDVAPTILHLLEAGHSQHFIGRNAFIQPAFSPKSYVLALEERLLQLAKTRGPVLRSFVIVQILVYLFSLIALIFNLRVVRLLQQLLLVFLALPLGLLLWAGPKWLILFWGLMFLFVCFKGATLLQKLLAIAVSTTAVIVLDVLRGSWLMRFSHLGYDPIGGARFYGLGNEFMGILVGSAVMSWTLFCQLYPLKPGHRALWGILFFSVVLVVIGAPFLGTNVGGAISAIVAFGFTWLLLQKKANLRSVLGLILLTGFILGVFLVADSVNPVAEQSHIGQTVSLFGRDGFSALKMIIRRKLTMNFRLLRYSIWSKALLVAVVVMGASFIWPSSFIRWLMKNYPTVSKGISGVVLGSCAALLFNDSGVVAAATCLFFSSTTLLILALQLKHNLTASQPYVEDNAHGH